MCVATVDTLSNNQTDSHFPADRFVGPKWGHHTRQADMKSTYVAALGPLQQRQDVQRPRPQRRRLAHPLPRRVQHLMPHRSTGPLQSKCTAASAVWLESSCAGGSKPRTRGSVRQSCTLMLFHHGRLHARTSKTTLTGSPSWMLPFLSSTTNFSRHDGLRLRCTTDDLTTSSPTWMLTEWRGRISRD